MMIAPPAAMSESVVLTLRVPSSHSLIVVPLSSTLTVYHGPKPGTPEPSVLRLPRKTLINRTAVLSSSTR